MMKRLQLLLLLASEPGAKRPPPTLKMFVGIEEKPSSSNVLESLLPPGPHGFSDLPTVLLLYGKNSL